MPDWFSQYEAKPAAHNDWFSQFEAEPVSGPRKFVAGAKAEAVGQVEGVKLLADTGNDVGDKLNPLHAAADMVKLARGDKADENVTLATLKGFGQGAWQGAKDLISHPVESLDPTGAVAVAKSKDDNWTKAGHASVLAGETLLPFLRPLKRIRGVRAAAAETQAEMRAVAAGLTPGPTDAVVAAGLGGPKAAPPGVPGGRLVKNPVKAPAVETEMARTIERIRGSVAPVELPVAGAQPPVSHPRAPRTNPPGRAPMPPDGKGLAAPPGREGHFTLPEKIATDAEFELARKQAGFGPSTGEMDRRAAGGALQPGQAERRGIRTPADVHGTPEAPVPVTGLGPDAFTTGPAMPPKFDLPLTAAQVAEEVAKRTGKPGVTLIGSKVTKRSLKPGVAQDARTALGAKRAADHITHNLSVPMTEAEVRAAAPGPSRRPLIADNAAMDAQYRRMRGGGRESGALDNQRGGVSPKLAMTMGGAAAGGAGFAAMADDDHKVGAGVVGALTGAALANPMATLRGLQQVRVGSMLSGAALPKSIAGNIGAVGTAAIEGHSLAPIKEALRVPTNARNVVAGWKASANPAQISGVGNPGILAKVNVFPRAMGAFDNATTQALQRAGLSLEEAQRLLLTSPNTMGDGNLGRMMKSPVGRVAFPFQNTPVNAVAEGGKSIAGMVGAPVTGMKPHTLTQKALTAGTIAAGAGAGSVTDDPKMLALLAALMGPRAIPFAMGVGGRAAIAGGGMSAAKRQFNQMGVGLPDGAWTDFVSPEAYARPIMDPAMLRFLEWIKSKTP